MGADNWATCPRCKEKAFQEYHKAVKTVSDAYGKVPEEDYQTMKAQLPNLDPNKGEKHCTLREDYDLGIDEDGTFEVSYCAHCKECGFKFDYKHEEKV